MATARHEQLDQIGRDWQRRLDEMRRDWRTYARLYGSALASAFAYCVAGFSFSLAAGARASEATAALGKGFLWGVVGFVGVSVFVAVVFRLAAHVRPQALAIGERKEPRRGRRWWFARVFTLSILLFFALGGRHLGGAFFGGFLFGLGLVGFPGTLLVTTFLYRGLIEPRSDDLIR